MVFARRATLPNAHGNHLRKFRKEMLSSLSLPLAALAKVRRKVNAWQLAADSSILGLASLLGKFCYEAQSGAHQVPQMAEFLAWNWATSSSIAMFEGAAYQ
jgi:hypothetical protein